MQQLYAKIKKSSKYFAQNATAKSMGEFPFPVTVDADTSDAYCVLGGPGGQYRMSDVSFYVKNGSNELRLA
jgi:hypothetical protein